MEKPRTPHPEDIYNNSPTLKSILYGVVLSILTVQGIIIYFYHQGGMKMEMLVLGVSIIPMLAALEIIRRNHVEIAGTIIAFALTIMVTVLATIGQGIHDIGIMAYPAILLIASLMLRKELTLSLTAIMVLCIGWLVYGEILGIYQPVYPDAANNRFFVIAISILAVTAIIVQLLSNMIRNSLNATQKELLERKRVERELRDAETMYRALVEQTSVVTYRDSPNADGATMYISPQIEQLLGYSVEEWRKNPIIWKDLTHPDDLPRVLTGIARYIATGEPTQIEYRMRTKGGQWKWVRDESVVIKDEQGKMQYVHGVLIDITERKEAEKKLKQRESVLSAVAYTAQQLMASTDWRNEIQNILARLGEATGASHVYIFENHSSADGATLPRNDMSG